MTGLFRVVKCDLGFVLKIILCAAFAAALCSAPQLAADAVKTALGTCARALIPALFPFLFVTDYLMGTLLNRLRSSRALIAAAVLFGFCGGFASGAKAVRDLVDSGTITPAQASRLLCGTVNAGPAFILSAVGAAMYGSSTIGLFMLAALFSSSLVTLLLFFPRGCKFADVSVKKSVSFVSSLSFAVNSITRICGNCLLFAVIVAYIRPLFATFGPLCEFALSALCDVSGACRDSVTLVGPAGAVAAMSICSVSILLQISAMLAGSSITLRSFLLSRLIHLPLSVAICTLLLHLSNSAHWAFAGTQAQSVRLSSAGPLFSCLLFLFSVFLVLALGNERKF